MSSANFSNEAPSGQVNDPSYKTKGTEAVPVIDDNAPVEDGLLPEEADSDRQLGTSSVSPSLFAVPMKSLGE